MNSKSSEITTLDQKIDIFEKFAQTGEKIDENTTFEGYSIGTWAMQIKTNINNIYVTKSQLERLEKLGILEKQIVSSIDEDFSRIGEWIKSNPEYSDFLLHTNDLEFEFYSKSPSEILKWKQDIERIKRYYTYTQEQNSENQLSEETSIDERILIDEKIDSLVDWIKKYPKAILLPSVDKQILREYAETDEEYKKICNEYKKMQEYYIYLRDRKSKNKLTEEQILKCKKGNVGGAFGYSVEVEDLAKKYNVSKKDMNYILTKYGTLDNFYKISMELSAYRKPEFEQILFDHYVDIDESSNKGYEQLLINLDGHVDLLFYSSKKMQELINKLPKNEKFVLNKRYNLINDEQPVTLEIIAEELGLSKERVRQIEQNALRNLRKAKILQTCCFTFRYDYKDLTDEEIKLVEEVRKDIILQNGDLSENIKKVNSIRKEIKERFKDEFEKRILAGEEPIQNFKNFSYEDLINIGAEPELADKIYAEIQEFNKKEILKIDKVGLSIRVYSSLIRSGVKSLYDLADMTEDELKKIRNLGQKGYAEVVSKMQEHDISFMVVEKPKTQSESGHLHEIGLLPRSYHALARSGIKSLYDLANMTEEEFKKIRNLGAKSYSDIVSKMQEYGISFKNIDNPEKVENMTEDLVTESQKNDEEPTTLNNEEMRSEDNKDEIKNSSEIEETVIENTEKQQEEIKLEEMTLEQLEEILNKNEETIKNNEEVLKQELIQKILVQQNTIAQQQSEIDRLKKIIMK